MNTIKIQNKQEPVMDAIEKNVDEKIDKQNAEVNERIDLIIKLMKK